MQLAGRLPQHDYLTTPPVYRKQLRSLVVLISHDVLAISQQLELPHRAAVKIRRLAGVAPLLAAARLANAYWQQAQQGHSCTITPASLMQRLTYQGMDCAHLQPHPMARIVFVLNKYALIHSLYTAVQPALPSLHRHRKQLALMVEPCQRLVVQLQDAYHSHKLVVDVPAYRAQLKRLLEEGCQRQCREIDELVANLPFGFWEVVMRKHARSHRSHYKKMLAAELCPYINRLQLRPNDRKRFLGTCFVLAGLAKTPRVHHQQQALTWEGDSVDLESYREYLRSEGKNYYVQAEQQHAGEASVHYW